MSIPMFDKIKEALGNLDPEEIRRHTERPVRLYFYAPSAEAQREMEQYFAPPELTEAKRSQAQEVFRWAAEGNPAMPGDIEIYFEDEPQSSQLHTGRVFSFRPDDPGRTVKEILHSRPELAIPLAMRVFPFREEVSRRIVSKVAKENALFALATALPDIMPLLTLPWAIPEFASDTAVLTANQIRMAFLLAAANDRDMGYREQKGEIVSIVLGAFGWRAGARELVGKIPMGGGLIPKAAIAYAGTRVVGLSLDRFYRLGYPYSRAERHQAYGEALERGRTVAASLLERFKRNPKLAE